MTVNLNKHKSTPLTVGTVTRLKGQDNDPKFFPTAEPGAKQWKIGDEVTITGVVIDPNATGSGVGYTFKGDKILFDSSWVEHTVPAGVVIAATLKTETAKGYAFKARSRKLLSDEHNAVLLHASEGEEIDVVEFRKAATSALSAATTRHGQSMGRRTWAKEARHLLHWADAIIDQHIQGLPIYEAGPRSAKIRDLQAENADLKARVTDHEKSLRNRAGDAEALALAASDVRSATQEIDRLTDLVRRQTENLSDLNGKVNAERQAREQAESERDHWASVVLYVGTRFGTEVQQVALAYSDGLDDA